MSWWKRPEKQPKRRGPGRSPEQKLKDEKAKMELELARSYREYLKAHPTYLNEVARQRFGLPEISFGRDESAPPDLLEDVRRVRELKDLLREELGGQEPLTATIAKAFIPLLPQFVALLRQAPQGLPETETIHLQSPAPQLEEAAPERPSVEQQQQVLLAYLQALMAAEPEAVAREIHGHREGEGDVRAIIWEHACENDFDQLMEQLNEVPGLENYEFLAPLIRQLQTAERRQWLALVYDELMALKLKEDEASMGQSEGEGE